MKRNILIVWLLFLVFSLNAQKEYRDAGLRYELPNDEWYLENEQRIAPRLWGIFYKRVGILNEKGVRIIPNMVVITEDLVDTEQKILQYALSHVNSKRYSHLQLEVDETIKLNLLDAIVFKGKYEDPRKIEHKVYIYFALNGDKGFQLVADVTADVFDEVEDEIISTIRSITF